MLILIFLSSLCPHKPAQALLSQWEGSFKFSHGHRDIYLGMGDKLQEYPETKSPWLGS